ncbi:hypothetical protein [Saccharothrix coeruleofusca]|uniref:Uncharacterized protein n=1 Tax=Saccharothrix coeruleofusca TaxID=33919 RepID=A0A918AIS5_9PSEU|nr:hypothetical protein [Saccharothrix coeruleofusca]MBP2334103.1 hypothetical protein [Saccharothrix coeruleofusca]GGP43409.1 hypothetical protein GCM10010185_13780 [Saccharothrix coeruleofusca]
MEPVSVTALSFTEYVMSGQRGRINIVSEQRSIYLTADRWVCGFYNPMRDAMRRAANSPDPEAELDRAVRSASLNGQLRAFEELRDGFLPWLRSTRATGVPTGTTRWSAGELTLKVRPHLGLLGPDGSTAAVLVYVKEQPMTQEVANVGLRILQHTMPLTLAGAEPLVLDARRGRAFRMSRRTNLAKLDALIAAEAAGYVVHWRMSA